MTRSVGRLRDIVGRNLSRLQELSNDELGSWLLRSFGMGSFEPLELSPEPSVQLQLRWLFDQSPPQVQERLKDGVVAAVKVWLSTAHSLEVLIDLGRGTK